MRIDDKVLIALTMGDPSGIGAEIILKGFLKFKERPWQVVVIGDYSFLQKKEKELNVPINLNPVDDISEADFSPEKLNILNMKNLPPDIPQGVANKESGKASYEYIKKAVELALADKVSAIVTAPINKKSISLAGLSYAGHTEMLAELTDTKDVAMMLIGGKIRVVLVTTHVAICKVNKFIKEDRIFKTISLANRSLRLFGINTPRIAVAGLNPHAGDSGIFGNEETNEILPAIVKAKEHGIDVTGPCPADSLFVKAKRGEFDVVIVMYHDQGLIPVKMEGFGKGVNVTLGLPIIRTSVDHGTAYDIAGKGITETGSLIAALEVAVTLTKNKKKKLIALP
ncbi:MAG: 4-hydroxythreonine-4-phosphate dehydrogenase PdxA [Nitrospinota bacterium]